MNSNKESKVLIIYTGGTVGMVHDVKTGSLKPFSFSSVVKQIPELKLFNCNINAVSFKKPIDSSNMNIGYWVEMATLIEESYSRYDGFVILHGSDTMAYSASALSFMFENLSKPIIFTGSQLPIGEIRTDAKENIITSLKLLLQKKMVKHWYRRFVFILTIRFFRGNRAVKFAYTKFEAFESFNFPALAEAGVNLTYNFDKIRKC